MNTYGYVYKSTNKITGKMYIGQTHYRKRMNPRYVGSGKLISEAVKQFGYENFTLEILFMAFNKEALNWAERHFIQLFDAQKSDQFYNKSPGGHASLGFTGKKHSLARNQKISQFLKENHPLAKTVELDGQKYPSMSAARRDSGYTPGQINRFIETGQHPTQQVHKLKNIKRNYKNGMRKKWLIQSNDKTFEIEDLMQWAKRQNLDYGALRNTMKNKKTVMGFKILKSINL